MLSSQGPRSAGGAQSQNAGKDAAGVYRLPNSANCDTFSNPQSH